MDIMKACARIWDEEGLESINLKRISDMTSFSRPTIYNYYKNREEILLDMLKEELRMWQSQLVMLQQKKEVIGQNGFSKEMTRILIERDQMLRLYSILFTLIEPNCTVETLADFKVVATEVLNLLVQVIESYYPEFTGEKAQVVGYEMICYILGLYPMTHLNEKQLEAVRLSNTGYATPDFKLMCETGISHIMGNRYE